MSRSELQTGFIAVDADRQSHWFLALCGSPWIWGTALTFVFYSLIPAWPAQREVLDRYYCAHWMLYVETWLFGVGLATLGSKILALQSEQGAFDFRLARNPGLRQATDWDIRLELLLRAIGNLPAGVRRSELIRRYSDAGEYVAARGNAVGLEEHLKYLQGLASQRLRDSYAITRTIIWALPIVGILGTVSGITLTLASVPSDPLDQSLSAFTGSLAVACDSTALALFQSLILVFGSFAVERGEQHVLGRVETAARRDLAPLFATDLSVPSPLLQAEQLAAARLMEQTEKLINWQTDLWQHSLDSLRTRWETVVQKQQTEFTRALQSGMESTLEQHHAELSDARQEMSAAFAALTTELVAMVTEVQERSEQAHLGASAEIASLWGDVQNELRLLRDDQTRQTEHLVNSLCDEVLTCRSDLKAATHASTGQLRELHAQGETLLKIVGEEADLARLQRTLANNLEAIHAVETFEKSLHTLTSAVHMLTIKNRAA